MNDISYLPQDTLPLYIIDDLLPPLGKTYISYLFAPYFFVVIL